MQTSFSVNAGKIQVSGPFSEKNNTVWRSLGGKFSDGAWSIPDNPSARERIESMFGAKSEIVDVLVPIGHPEVKGSGTLQIGGYVLASRRFRDGRVAMPSGVSLAAGSFPSSGGSVKSPRVSAADDTVFRLSCRASFAAAMNLSPAPTTAVPSEI